MSTVAPPPPKKGCCLVTLLKIGLLLILLAAIAIYCIGQFVLDGKYDVSREVTIHASPAAVHKEVGDLREWPNWLPFTKQDPSIQVTIDKPTGVGAKQHWTGKNGNGELTFVADDENKGIEFDMLTDNPKLSDTKYASRGSISYAKSGDDTKVTWRMTGHNTDFVGKWMALVTPAMVGPMFDQGLADLKNEVESAKK